MEKSLIISNLKKLGLKSLLVFPIITLTSLLQFCGPSATKSIVSSSYQEDLSIYRDDFEPVAEETEISDTSIEEVVIKSDIEPTHGIAAELDSVTQIIIASRKEVKLLDGFTIQLYSGNSRDQANEYKAAAYEMLADTKPT